jgi:hypothetical protein
VVVMPLEEAVVVVMPLVVLVVELGVVVVVVGALVVGVVAGEVPGTVPAAVMTCHLPPKAVIPAPTVEPLRPLKNMYSG